jgi:hypothetical protein
LLVFRSHDIFGTVKRHGLEEHGKIQCI